MGCLNTQQSYRVVHSPLTHSVTCWLWPQWKWMSCRPSSGSWAKSKAKWTTCWRAWSAWRKTTSRSRVGAANTRVRSTATGSILTADCTASSSHRNQEHKDGAGGGDLAAAPEQQEGWRVEKGPGQPGVKRLGRGRRWWRGGGGRPAGGGRGNRWHFYQALTSVSLLWGSNSGKQHQFGIRPYFLPSCSESFTLHSCWFTLNATEFCLNQIQWNQLFCFGHFPVFDNNLLCNRDAASFLYLKLLLIQHHFRNEIKWKGERNF